MKARRINSNKPHLWKADIAASVDQFNQWFMRFAPEAFRSTRVETTEHVKAALVATNDLRTLNAATLKANPGALPTLRMCTAPPLAVDRLGTPGFLALQREGIRLIDSAPVTTEAREVKTAEEIELLELNSQILMEMLGAFEGAIAPGVRERDLLAVLVDTLLRSGGEHVATSTVCSGPNTNPWRAEATDRAIESGDLVYVDTDTIGVEGYFFCVSRTFLCAGAEPSPSQLDAYRAAHGWLLAMRDVIRPGVTCAELAERAPKIPDRYMPQRYECMIHSIGLEEESPSVAHPVDPQPNPDRVIREDMALVVELYCGEVGGRDGVKLGDQVLVTRDGPKVLVPYPYDDALL